MIYVRSRRSIVTVGAGGLVVVLVFAGLAAALLTVTGGLIGSVAFAIGALGAAAVALWAGLQLRNWPPGRLGFFRDRLVVIQGRHEMRALWERMQTATLADIDSFPSVRLTDRLTISLRDEDPLTFKPALFGLQPSACRDLILRLRDDERLRARLPEFDSARDLTISPVVSGELIEPRI